jgi:hypothetical protein
MTADKTIVLHVREWPPASREAEQTAHVIILDVEGGPSIVKKNRCGRQNVPLADLCQHCWKLRRYCGCEREHCKTCLHRGPNQSCSNKALTFDQWFDATGYAATGCDGYKA